MRWPWQPKPGMVRISRRELIDLQARALRAYELEASVRDLRIQRSRFEAQVRVIGLNLPGLASVHAIANEPPLTRDGQLHEPALKALVDVAVWADRESELTRLGIIRD